MRKKVSIEEFLKIEKLLQDKDKANAMTVVSIRSSLDSLK
jgi:hypothetical protein